MIERKYISSKVIPCYQSTTVNRNDDETYEVKHVFVDDNGRKILIKYPKVKITIDASVDVFSRTPRVFPYGDYQVLPFGENEELFTLTIEE